MRMAGCFVGRPPMSHVRVESSNATSSRAGAAHHETAVPRAGSRLGVLRHRHFRNVWGAALISNTGGWMEMVGVQWVMKELTVAPDWVAAGKPGAMTMMGYLAAAQLGPTLILGLVGGLLADRVNRKRLLLVTQLMLMSVATTLAAASFMGLLTPLVLIGLGLAHGVSVAFNVPAWQVLTPRLVPRDELTRAIALNGVQFNLARVVGPGLAGVLMATFGPSVLFTINAVSFLAVLSAIWGTPDAPVTRVNGVKASSQLREAFAFVFLGKGPLCIFVGMVTFSMLAAPVLRMMPLFVSEVYGAAENTYGVLLALMGVGAVCGGLALKFVPTWYPKHHLIPLAILGEGLTILVFSAVDQVWAAGVLIALSGFFWLWTFNSSIAAVQLLVPDAMRGRVLAVCNTAVFGAMPLGSLLAAFIGEIAGGRDPDGSQTALAVQVGVGTPAAALALAGLIMLIWRTPEVDGLKPGDVGFERRPGLLRGITGIGHRPIRVDEMLVHPASMESGRSARP